MHVDDPVDDSEAQPALRGQASGPGLTPETDEVIFLAEPEPSQPKPAAAEPEPSSSVAVAAATLPVAEEAEAQPALRGQASGPGLRHETVEVMSLEEVEFLKKRKKSCVEIPTKGCWLQVMLEGEKHVEYRKISHYWTHRLFDRSGTPLSHAMIRQGYGADKPSIFVNIIGIDKVSVQDNLSKDEAKELAGEEEVYAIKIQPVKWYPRGTRPVALPAAETSPPRLSSGSPASIGSAMHMAKEREVARENEMKALAKATATPAKRLPKRDGVDEGATGPKKRKVATTPEAMATSKENATDEEEWNETKRNFIDMLPDEARAKTGKPGAFSHTISFPNGARIQVIFRSRSFWATHSSGGEPMPKQSKRSFSWGTVDIKAGMKKAWGEAKEATGVA